MRHRFTIKELSEMSDDEIFCQLCVDRQTTCTNVYAPLFTKLSKIISKLGEKINKKREEIWKKENEKQYPEHDKMHLVKDKSQFMGEFLEWLQTEQKVTLGEYTDKNLDTLFPILYKSVEKWLALYFDIDLNKIEEERFRMLTTLREDNS